MKLFKRGILLWGHRFPGRSKEVMSFDSIKMLCPFCKSFYSMCAKEVKMHKLESPVSSSKKIVSKLVLLTAALILILSTGVAPASARATVFTDNVRFPIEIIVFVPCAAGGIGEEVLLSGNLHVLFRTTIDSRGGFHSKFHAQPQGLSGVGLTTGDRYRGTGVTQDKFNGRVGSTYTFVNNFNIIGQGPGNNAMIHQTFHVTVNARGQVTAVVDNFRATCRSTSYP